VPRASPRLPRVCATRVTAGSNVRGHSDDCRCQFGALVRKNGSYGVPLEYSGDGVAKTLAREKIGHELYLVSFSAYNGPACG